MAAGLPCVATRVGGNAELIAHGITGVLVPASDPQRLAEALTFLAGDPETSAAMGRAARRRAEERFSLDGMIRRYEDLYETLVFGAPRRTPDPLPLPEGTDAPLPVPARVG
jgi:glycosyltransferase involved in cell wall biosynthesis